MKQLNFPFDEPFFVPGHPWRQKPFDILLGRGDNSREAITILYTGIPIIHVRKELTGWEDTQTHIDDRSWWDAYISFLILIGELPDDAAGEFASAGGGYHAFADRVENGDGHAYCDFLDKICEAADSFIANGGFIG
jgi:hypothetical protein